MEAFLLLSIASLGPEGAIGAFIWFDVCHGRMWLAARYNWEFVRNASLVVYVLLVRMRAVIATLYLVCFRGDHNVARTSSCIKRNF